MKLKTNLKIWQERYDRWFSVHEIYESWPLKVCLMSVLASYFITFKVWVYETRFTVDAVAESAHLCWPYFKNCGDWYFLSTLPHGYSGPIFYMGLFTIIGLSAWFMVNGKWRAAHVLIWPLLFWKMLVVLVLSMTQVGNYEYYHIVFSLILLAFPHKSFFLKFAIVWFYFLSTAAKIHPAWTLGTYFSSLKTGLPIFPDVTIPFWTNLVMILEMVAAWWLLRPKSVWQRLVVFFFVVFHLYSGILVGYRYPSTVLPLVFVLFGPWYEYEAPPKGLTTIPGWLLIGLLGVGQSLSHFIPGDEKMTMEGNFYGLYMFEANHQCVERTTIYRENREPYEVVKESFQARNRCDVYRVWFKRNHQCQLDPSIERVEVTYDHSINGGPFYRIVDEPDLCAVDYKPFSHNEWIILPEEGAEKIGYPMQNYYY